MIILLQVKIAVLGTNSLNKYCCHISTFEGIFFGVLSILVVKRPKDCTSDEQLGL